MTYGGMSKKPVILPTPLLIFKDISAKGFWLSGDWYQNCEPLQRQEMTEFLVRLVKEGSLVLKKTRRVPFREAMGAIQEQAGASKFPGKVVFDMM